jgi:hypothetical protein
LFSSIVLLNYASVEWINVLIRKNVLITLKCKPRDKPAAYTRLAKKQKITAQPPNKCSNSHQNLTLADWLSVYAFIEYAHPYATFKA